ncbi:MAG: flagellar motor switch protein FliN [Proteobacteria bacterium]|nr:flagellar motor switch protein FliN [Pseudomonadota bacterium]NOG58945.1 flagellar motor switch protein FliN [Pseudomonadota bacterium]
MTEETSTAEEDVGDDWAEAMSEQSNAEEEGATANSELPEAPLQDLQPENGGNGETTNLEAILDIPVSLSVEIGQTKISIKNLLQLNQGSVVELERLAGEPLDVKVNTTLVAHGEIVVVNEKYGIRLTDIVSAQERVKKLQ